MCYKEGWMLCKLTSARIWSESTDEQGGDWFATQHDQKIDR